MTPPLLNSTFLNALKEIDLLSINQLMIYDFSFMPKQQVLDTR